MKAVKLIGGNITATSTINEGSLFEVTIPTTERRYAFFFIVGEAVESVIHDRSH